MVAWLQERKLYYIGGALSALFSGGCALLYAHYAGLPRLELLVTVWEWTTALALLLLVPASMIQPDDEAKYRFAKYRWRREPSRWLARGAAVTFAMALLVRAIFGLGLTVYFV